ncbi:hypothetical protein, conserved [Angomonas deanei]|uniref:Nodulin-like n=1 Tax=Angomonas deanei TaxID=59799 RepID=A0A7G2CUQ2_9TRYP|nr:hypothetical protein, conserved [Angomonas deanei]
MQEPHVKTEGEEDEEVKAQLYVLDQHQKPISENKRFALLTLACFSIVCTSFGSHTYNLVAPDLLTRYHLDQRDSTIIVTCGMVVGYSVLPYSVVYDFFGPLPIAIISVFVFPLGALLIGFCFQNIIAGNLVRLCVFYSFMNVGTTYYDMICVQTLLYYFPTKKGHLVALVNSMMGIGSSMNSLLFSGFFPDRSAFFYFLMVYAIICAVLNCFFMRFPKYHLTGYEERKLTEAQKAERLKLKAPYLNQEPSMIRFYYGIVLVIIVIIYTTIASSVINYREIVEKDKLLPFAVVTVILWGSFAFIMIPFEIIFGKKNKNTESESTEPTGEPFEEDEELAKKEECEVTIAKPLEDDYGNAIPELAPVAKETPTVFETEVDFIAPQYQTSFWRNLLSPNLWCLLWTLFIVQGTELMIMTNATFIYASLSGEIATNNFKVLLNVFNGAGTSAGRLVMSAIEIWIQRRPVEKRTPLTILLFFPSVSVIFTGVLMLVLPKAALPLPYMLSALGSGCLSAIIVLIPRTLYARDPAKHYNFLFLATAIAVILINRLLYGEWYIHAAKGALVCLHRSCVQMPLIVCVSTSVTAFATNIILHLRYGRFCKKVFAERAKLRGEVVETSQGSDEERL